MSSSRTSYVVKNIGAAGFFQLFALFLSFVSRTIFVRLLGNDYLSCEGLFSNVLTILSFTELGIGSSIIYSLYKPIADEDKVQIGKLMNLFRKSYIWIACIISFVGLSVIPFMDYIVKDVPSVKESIILLYLLFLGNTVASYIFGYKRSFLIACQKNYVVLTIQQVFNVVRIALQVGLLLWTHDYVLYLAIAIVCTLGGNIVSTYITNRQYPWLNGYLNNQLTKEERKPIVTNILAIIQYKLGYVFLQGTGNILISVCIATYWVGICSNYNLIIGAIQSLLSQLFSSIQSTIGNFNTLANETDKKRLFFTMYFINFWVTGVIIVMIALFISPFVSNIWLGKEYELDTFTSLSICFSFYVLISNMVPSTFRSAMGFFKQAKGCPIYAALLNIVLCLIFSKWMGLSGIFIAHGIARLFTFSVIDAYYVSKLGIGISPLLIYKRIVVYGLSLVGIYITESILITFIPITNDGIGGFCINVALFFIVTNLLLFILYFRTQDFQNSYTYIIQHIKRKK